uniref:Glutamate-gated metabotropic ion channel receptor subunit grm2 n=1 Tax=Rhipicephalus zambeziensis TaxID=60191 RepID=A0A224YZH7_9ACAR
MAVSKSTWATRAQRLCAVGLFLSLSMWLQWFGSVTCAEDPSPAIYPGQANIALLMPLRTAAKNGTGDASAGSNGDGACGSLDPRRVRLALAGVWAAQQANFRKAPSDFNLGVYLYDTCGRDDVALRQSVRVIHQAGHVRSMACPTTRVPPVFGAILQGDVEAVETAAKTLASFSIPAVAARDVPAESVRRLRNLYSTAPAATSLARALASTLRRLGWSYVAVMSTAEDRPRELSRAFLRVARDMAIDIMSADAPAGFSYQQVQEALGSTKQLVESGCRAAALFVTPAEAKAFLVSYEPDPDAAFSWVLVTPGDVTASLAGLLAPHKLRRLRHVLFAAPDDTQRPAEYGDYLRDLMDRDGSAPLLQELRKTYSRNDVVQRWDDEMSDSADAVAVIRAVWAMGAALRAVQRVQCGRGTDCLFGGRQGLSASVLEALDSLNFNMTGAGVASLSDTPLKFSHERHVATLKYAVKAVSTSGEVLQISGYTDDTGLEVDDVLVPTRGPFIRGYAVEAGKTSVKPSTRQRSSNLRSSNLEIHNDGVPQPLGDDTTSSPSLSQTASDEDYGALADKTSTAPGAVRLAKPKLYTLWIAKPWTLAVVIMSGLGILLSAYVAVFLLMKLCEGVVRKGHQLTSLLLLLSVVSLFLSALLFTFRPKPRLCAVQQLAHHTSYAFAFGALLLKGMHLNAMQSAGLGGRASGLNQLLTICFLVAVQMALEAQAWMLSPPRWCKLNQTRFLLHQAYPCVVLALAVLMAFRTRNCSYHRRDARSLLCTSLLAVPILAAGHTAFLLLGPGEHQIAALSFALIATGFLILVGIFAPYLRALHKRGGYGHKPLSYSDSSASAFTTFQHHHKDSGSAIPECCYVRGGRAVTIVQQSNRNGAGPSHHVRNPLYIPGSAYP